MKYVLISEDGLFRKTDTLTDDDYKAESYGILEIVRVADLKRYYCGDWVEIKAIDN